MINSTARSVLTLFSGNIVARIFTFILTPLLARLYSPEDFGYFALYTSILGPLAAVCTGRYHLAIFLPEKDSDALDLITLSISFCVAVSTVVLIVVGLGYSTIVETFKFSSIGPLVFLVPVSLIFVAIFETHSSYFNRVGKYRLIVFVLIFQTLVSCIVQLVSGYIGLKVTGLVLGHFFGGGITALVCLINGPRLHIVKENLIILGKKYKGFPLMSTWAGLFNGFAHEVPIWLITKSYAPEYVGAFAFAFRVVNVPLSMVSGSITQVLHQKIANNYRENPENIVTVVLKFMLLLCGFGIPVIVVCYFWAEDIFTFIFGDKWAMAGELTSITIFAFVVRFIVSPLTSTLSLDRHLKKGVSWQILYFTTTCCVLYIASSLDFNKFILIFVIHEIVLYVIYLLIVLYAANFEKNRVRKKKGL